MKNGRKEEWKGGYDVRRDARKNEWKEGTDGRKKEEAKLGRG